MELPFRAKGDQLLRAGELTDIRRRLRGVADRHDLATVIACAFDRRTRMLPFIFSDTRMAPAGVRAIGSALADTGFEKTRIVLQHWNRNFRPTQMRLDGRVPDLFCVSSMSLHMARAKELIRDARRIDPARRPLIIAGGSVCVFEPWEIFSNDPADPHSPDLAVTGEEYVLLELLEALLAERAEGESLRSVFFRARDAGALDGIPGLIYGRGGADGAVEELVDTGIQRLAGDLDELPHPALGFGLLEAPSRGRTLASRPMAPAEVGRHSRIASLVMTFGCKFACEYCPIPAYNQRHLRRKSAGRIVDEFARISREYGIRYFFGTDDNFFADRAHAEEVVESLTVAQDDAGSLRRRVRWGTEVTVHDAWAMREHLPLARDAGLRALWMGVEDMTGALVSKGQTAQRTTDLFERLRRVGISPMPMLMHHDAQPLSTPGRLGGLINQVRTLQKAGAVTVQVLMLTPSAGSRSYEDTFRSGLVYDAVGGRPVEAHMYDGNYVIASGAKTPWRKQRNILLAYLSFYNPLRLLTIAFGPKDRLRIKRIGAQFVGMAGLACTVRRTFGWLLRLLAGRIRRKTAPPHSPVPMRTPAGQTAPHDLPGLSDQQPRTNPRRAAG